MLLARGESVDPANIVVSFTTTSGADHYQAVASTDVWFRRATVATKPLVSVPPDGRPTMRVITLNASRLVNKAKQGQLFITIRARASRGRGRGVTYRPSRSASIHRRRPAPSPAGIAQGTRALGGT